MRYVRWNDNQAANTEAMMFSADVGNRRTLEKIDDLLVMMRVGQPFMTRLDEVQRKRSAVSGEGLAHHPACMSAQAHYILPQAIARFLKKIPDTRLEFFQGSRQNIFAQVDAGHADIAIGGDCGVNVHVAMLNCGTLHYSIIMRPSHALFKKAKPSLRDVTAYPIITHMFEPDGQWKLIDAFRKKGLNPNIVFRAADAEIAKAYVELGIGIAILAKISFDKNRDHTHHLGRIVGQLRRWPMRNAPAHAERDRERDARRHGFRNQTDSCVNDAHRIVYRPPWVSRLYYRLAHAHSSATAEYPDFLP